MCRAGVLPEHAWILFLDRIIRLVEHCSGSGRPWAELCVSLAFCSGRSPSLRYRPGIWARDALQSCPGIWGPASGPKRPHFSRIFSIIFFWVMQQHVPCYKQHSLARYAHPRDIPLSLHAFITSLTLTTSPGWLHPPRCIPRCIPRL